MQTQRYATCHELFWLKKERETGSITRTHLQLFHLFASPSSWSGDITRRLSPPWLQAPTPGHGILPRHTSGAPSAAWCRATHPTWVPRPVPSSRLLLSAVCSPAQQVPVGLLILPHKTKSTCGLRSLLFSLWPCSRSFPSAAGWAGRCLWAVKGRGRDGHPGEGSVTPA